MSAQVAGVDGTKGGWVAVELVGGRLAGVTGSSPYRPLACSTFRGRASRGAVARPCHNGRIKIALLVLAVGAVAALLITSMANGGCLPWQERVSGYAENTFGRERTATLCRGSWLPFGSTASLDGRGR